ncbi:COG4705 family protein [Sulfuriferula nivalis]|uniref:Membrane protein n=1 Tax=Sulfuriferula nivalis TaxID=2675298 RepID=A0A809RFI0_9PROT|nr:hypothetical protein [Sulfuriferula nivalis]BBO99633.1 membrane protein [Sulfuriferula nivalis]
MNKLFNRVPEITLFFWVIKIMATTVGETAADFLAFTMKLGLINTSWVMSGLLVFALLIQFKLKRYVPVSYWLVVVMVSVVGTLITDNLVDNLGVSLVTITVVFSIALAVVFALWYASEKTLSIHSIYTARRELFYWAAILFTFALGTAAGDLVAEHMALGYAISALMFGSVIAVIALAYYRFKLNAVLAFWLAYILTRPFGASMGDLLSQPVNVGGLGFGTIGISGVFLGAIVILIAYLSMQQKQQLLTASSAE